MSNWLNHRLYIWGEWMSNVPIFWISLTIVWRHLKKWTLIFSFSRFGVEENATIFYLFFINPKILLNIFSQLKDQVAGYRSSWRWEQPLDFAKHMSDCHQSASDRCKVISLSVDVSWKLSSKGWCILSFPFFTLNPEF